MNDTLEFYTVDLDDMYKNTETGAEKGLVIDGVIIRVDDLYFFENDDKEVEMNVDYKIIDGTPKDMVDFEQKIISVMLHITKEEHREDE